MRYYIIIWISSSVWSKAIFFAEILKKILIYVDSIKDKKFRIIVLKAFVKSKILMQN